MLESEARRLDAPVLPPPGSSADPSGETTTGTGGQPRL
jgi:hypothetical protein